LLSTCIFVYIRFLFFYLLFSCIFISLFFFFFFFFHCSGPHRDLHSFPTRRSSDLYRHQLALVPDFLLLHARRRQEAILVGLPTRDRKSTRLNSSHVSISYAVFCLKKKKKIQK